MSTRVYTLNGDFTKNSCIGKSAVSPCLRNRTFSSAVICQISGSILDTYVLEFLDLPEQFSERNLSKAITENLKQFIKERFDQVNHVYKFLMFQLHYQTITLAQ